MSLSRPTQPPVWMSAPQLEPQPIGQRPNAQLRQLQRVDFSSDDTSNHRPRKRTYEEMECESDPNDTVRLWEEGWRGRYYKNKFNVDKDEMDEFRVEVAHHYARGLCWVLQYYYQGVPAWDW